MVRKRVRIGAPDGSLTPVAGMAAVTELVDRLRVVQALDAAVGRIKVRARGRSAGQLLVGMAAAQLAGEDFLVGLDRQRADIAGQALAPVAGLASTTAAGLARRLDEGQWQAVESGVAAVTRRMLDLLPAPRRSALTATVTIDLDTTDVEVYGRKKRGVAHNYQGQRCGRPHVAAWAETGTVLAADLLPGDADPRPGAAGLLRRAVAGLPADVGRVQARVDAGYFAGDLARAAREMDVEFAIGAKRITTVWRALSGLGEADWADAIDMPAAQVAVSGYAPHEWPEGTRLLIRRVRLDASQVSADPRARRRRTIPADQLELALSGQAAIVYGYSFILTDRDVSTPAKAASVEHWYRHRTEIEDRFRDSKHGAALRHLPSGYPEVNTAWMWGALLATSIAGWLHQLTATTGDNGRLTGHGPRGGKAMIATLRHLIIRVPGRLITHAGQQVLRLPPGRQLLAEILSRLRALPTTS
jgi:Transposase DDE domain group 1